MLYYYKHILTLAKPTALHTFSVNVSAMESSNFCLRFRVKDRITLAIQRQSKLSFFMCLSTDKIVNTNAHNTVLRERKRSAIVLFFMWFNSSGKSCNKHVLSFSSHSLSRLALFYPSETERLSSCLPSPSSLVPPNRPIVLRWRLQCLGSPLQYQPHPRLNLYSKSSPKAGNKGSCRY